MSALSYAFGAVLFVATTISLLKVLIVPRRAFSVVATPSHVVMVRTFHAIARRLRSPDLADRFLGFLGPLYVVVLLASFLALYTGAFAAMLAPARDHDWGAALRESGSSVFTLGFESTNGVVPSVVDTAAAATGMIVIALFIAYLPTLYAAVKDRERFVKLVQSRIDQPPVSGVNVLASHYERGTEALLAHLYREAETWAVGVSETHAKYPVLLHFRAPRSPLHWLSTMVAVADAAALHQVLLPAEAPVETRAVIDAITLCLADLAHTAGADGAVLVAPAVDDATMLAEAVAQLRAVGESPVDPGPTTAQLAEIRARYGGFGNELMDRVAAPAA